MFDSFFTVVKWYKLHLFFNKYKRIYTFSQELTISFE